MTWAYPERMAWLWLLPAFIGFAWWASKRRAVHIQRYAAVSLLPGLTLELSRTRRRWRSLLLFCALAALLLALIGPRWGMRLQQIKRRGVDIVVALDVSRSMLAQDVKPNRLERAKLAIQDLVHILPGDRIGLVLFAGTAFEQCPLTVDYAAFLLTLAQAGPHSIPRGGTALAHSVRASLKAFSQGSEGSRALVLMTDGEDHQGDVSRLIKEVQAAGVRVYAVGIGTPEGELIPEQDLSTQSGPGGFVKDAQGHVVKSRLNEEALKELALNSGGVYLRATNTAFGLDRLYREHIANLEKRDFEDALSEQSEHRFQWPLAIAFVLLLAEWGLGDYHRDARTRAART